MLKLYSTNEYSNVFIENNDDATVIVAGVSIMIAFVALVLLDRRIHSKNKGNSRLWINPTFATILIAVVALTTTISGLFFNSLHAKEVKAKINHNLQQKFDATYNDNDLLITPLNLNKLHEFQRFPLIFEDEDEDGATGVYYIRFDPETSEPIILED